MGLLDDLSGYASSAADYATSVGNDISSFADDWGFDVSSVIKDAATNAVIAGVSGGDVGKAALWGGFGSIVGGSAALGEWGNEIGGAVRGYGLADATGNDGLLGAALGAAYEHSTDGTAKVIEDSADAGSEKATDGSMSKTSDSTESGGMKTYLQSNGLLDSDGQPTKLAEIGLGAVKGYMADKAQDEQLKEMRKTSQFNSDLINERSQYNDELKFKDQQRNIGAFGSRR